LFQGFDLSVEQQPDAAERDGHGERQGAETDPQFRAHRHVPLVVG
jgi:hypothetical protein